MKTKAFFVITLFALFSSLLFSQVKSVAALNGDGPISGPITSPVTPGPTPTPPITFPSPTPLPTQTPTPSPTVIPTPSPVVSPSPTPAPVAEHILSGRVEYKFTFKFFKQKFSFNIPAAGVHVVAVRTSPPWGYQSDTDFFGNFKFKLSTGTYYVFAYDNHGTGFKPDYTVVELNKNQNNLYFQGIR